MSKSSATSMEHARRNGNVHCRTSHMMMMMMMIVIWCHIMISCHNIIPY